MATRINSGKSPQPEARGSDKLGKYAYNTYDPGAYRVTLHPSTDDNGNTNFFYDWHLAEHLYTHDQGMIEILQFAPGEALEASLNEANIRTHIGVGGEILRTFPQHQRGTITMRLYSNGDEARTLSEMFAAASNTNNPLHTQISPIGTINVTANLAEVKNATIVKGEDCWLTKTPSFHLSGDISVATFVFDCASLYVSHGAPSE